MKIKVQRYCKHRTPNPSIMIEYEVPLKNPTLLESLEYIKSEIDQTISFDSGCRSEVCGSCAVRVNGREKLSCGYKVKDGDVVEPLKYLPIIKDLVVEADVSFMALVKTRAFLEKEKAIKQTYEDEKRVEKQSDCILCNSCYSACPVVEVNKNFLAPFVMTRVYRYISDKRCQEEKSKLELLQKDGIWDCTLCGECSAVCPQNIDPKMDIMMLRSKSGANGFMDPNFSNSFGGGLDFGGGVSF
jgi:fumarate reductase iron-sulfur subunit